VGAGQLGYRISSISAMSWETSPQRSTTCRPHLLTARQQLTTAHEEEKAKRRGSGNSARRIEKGAGQTRGAAKTGIAGTLTAGIAHEIKNR